MKYSNISDLIKYQNRIFNPISRSEIHGLLLFMIVILKIYIILHIANKNLDIRVKC